MTTRTHMALRQARDLGAGLGTVALVTVAVGHLITQLLVDYWAEGMLNRQLARERTPRLNAISDIISSTADTPVIIGVTATAAFAFRIAFQRWRESVFLIVAVTAQSWIFLLATVFVPRSRPSVPHLDAAPPTSSYPSGHASAAMACYFGIALVLILHMRHRVVLSLLWGVLGLTLAIGVAWARVYRGMHYFTDVVWGLLLGLVCLLVTGWVILLRPHPGTRGDPDGASQRSDPAS
ncbi:phosphatase PAP2 family protein [Nonomuraea sp. SYSU D8015]|uniref:phosphatase PAP2 family protein n=1 Tax=Nonomuraea sp. SYSU D8015 TaxID=2593644 RepID=UPI001660F49E|nr:phosphatase PAP2 family protein [Nonomuraea sp. SYSU D8015]